jgi:hypothetical protein
VARRHADVDDCELGLMVAHELEELGRRARLPDDFEPRAVEQARQALAEKDVIVC